MLTGLSSVRMMDRCSGRIHPWAVADYILRVGLAIQYPIFLQHVLKDVTEKYGRRLYSSGGR